MVTMRSDPSQIARESDHVHWHWLIESGVVPQLSRNVVTPTFCVCAVDETQECDAPAAIWIDCARAYLLPKPANTKTATTINGARNEIRTIPGT